MRLRSGARSLWHGWFNAQAFFTRLPCPPGVEFTPPYQRLALRLWPLCGWLVGGVAAAVYTLAEWCLPTSIAVLAALAAALWLTGALHEDGFADLCDGLGSGADAARALQIMHDPRVGAFALIGTVLLLLGKFALLGEIAQRLAPAAVAALLVGAHALSRFAALLLVWRLRYVGGGRRGGAMTDPITTAGLACAAPFGLLPLLLWPLLGQPLLLAAALAAPLTVALLSRVLRRRLGGFTGDTLGAAQQLAEIAYYLAVCALLETA